MDESERVIRRKILILEEDWDTWKPWHCYKTDCKHHMCRVRDKKMRYIDYALHRLYAQLSIVMYHKRSSI